MNENIHSYQILSHQLFRSKFLKQNQNLELSFQPLDYNTRIIQPNEKMKTTLPCSETQKLGQFYKNQIISKTVGQILKSNIQF